MDNNANLILYRQATPGDFATWIALDPIFSAANQQAFGGSWSGVSTNFFETSSVLRLGTYGGQPSAPGGRDIVAVGSQANFQSLWVKGHYGQTSYGAVGLIPDYAGKIDWGNAYAFVSFPAPRTPDEPDYANQ